MNSEKLPIFLKIYKMDVLKKFRIWIKDVLFQKQKLKPPELFCLVCDLPKQSRFCENCKKETSNLFLKTFTDTTNLNDSMNGFVQRGECSWSYFPLTYTVLLGIFISVISILDITPTVKVVLIIISAVFLFWLCFFNDRFRNFTVRVFSCSRQHQEKFKG